MRVLLGFVCAVFLPALSFADIIQYTFTGTSGLGNPYEAGAGWSGPGPAPATFQMTFDVNTLSPQNSVSYTFGPNDYTGPTIYLIDASLATTDFSLIVDGQLVSQSPTGSFSFGGTPLGGNSFVGGNSAGDQNAGFDAAGDFFLPVILESQLVVANDPLSLMLNGSQFYSNEGAVFYYEGSRASFVVHGEGTLLAPTPVPLPGTLPLLFLGMGVLGLVHGRRSPAAAAAR